MHDPMALTSEEFQRGLDAYQMHVARDPIYETATFLLNHSWGEPRKMADGLGVLLLTWNQGFYRFGQFDFNLLEESLQWGMPVIAEFRKRHIKSLTQTDEVAVEQLFLSLLDALRRREGKRIDQKSPVAVAKALHLLAPDFFPIWDEKIADAYGCYYASNPAKQYLTFAMKMQELWRALNMTVPLGTGRTFLKLIDEYNYAKFTKNWE